MTRLALVAAMAAVSCTFSLSAQDAGWVSIFDGKTTAGWEIAENPQSWTIDQGSLVTRGPRSHIYYAGPVGNHDFRNFELAAEVMTEPGSNGGIFVHTRNNGPGFPPGGYELQVINSNPVLAPNAPPNAYVEHKMTGSIYAIRNTWVSPVKDNEWFQYRIRVVGKTIQTFVNDALICEYTEPEKPFRAPNQAQRLLGSGTIGLQAHDPASVVRYRALRVRLLPDTAKSDVQALTDPEMDELVTQLSTTNIPLIDFGLAPPASGLAREAFNAELRRYGVTPATSMPLDALSRYGRSVLIVNDRTQAPDPEMLKQAKASGTKIGFSSGGDSRIDEARLKRRLQAIRAAALVAQDFWIPGKN